MYRERRSLLQQPASHGTRPAGGRGRTGSPARVARHQVIAENQTGLDVGLETVAGNMGDESGGHLRRWGPGRDTDGRARKALISAVDIALNVGSTGRRLGLRRAHVGEGS